VILQALLSLAEREGLVSEPDFEPKPVAWLIRLDSSGRLLGIQGTHHIPTEEAKKRKPKQVAGTFMLPREKARTSGDRAFFLFDKAEYVFGIDPIKEVEKRRSAEQLKIRAALFREKVKACLDATGDEGVLAIQAFLDQLEAGIQKVELPEGCATNDLFTFVVEPDIDNLAVARPKVKEFWKRLRATDAGVAAGEPKHCLVSGDAVHEPVNFPPLRRVPGGSTSGVALVSFNSDSFESYGWDKNENAPISRRSSEACSTALNRLLHPAYPNPRQNGQNLPSRHIRVSSDTVVCFWSAKESGDEFCSLFGPLLNANPDEVKALYHSVWRGKAPAIEDPSAFYALTLTGTQGRAIVRGWLESTVGEVARNLAQHFADLDIVRNTRPAKDRSLPPNFALAVLAESLAPGGDREKIPAPLVTDLMNAALRGTPYPLSTLQRALERARAEAGRSEWLDLARKDARAALIKAVLNRRRRFFPDTCHYPEVKKDMDPNANSPGYSLGRLMAVLERLQALAINNANATVVDRFFGGASATPKAVFVRLLKNARHHARKAMDSESGGMAFRLERIIDELTGPFQPKTNGFPAHLDLEQQGLFVLGYHQMRKWLWMSNEERAVWEAEHPDAPKPYVWPRKD
jgi:CRISPR-associated protein Csd1